MEPRTSRTLLPKQIYLDYIQKYAASHPDTRVVKLVGRRAMPYELRRGATVVLSFDRWYNIMGSFFYQARERIIGGERLSMGHIGWIHGKRIERNFKNKCINWKQTNAQPKVYSPEKDKMVPVRKVYFIEDEYCRIGWSCRKKDNMQYRFVPTHSSRKCPGFKQQFSLALMNTPALKYRYTFHPVYRPSYEMAV